MIPLRWLSRGRTGSWRIRQAAWRKPIGFVAGAAFRFRNSDPRPAVASPEAVRLTRLAGRLMASVGIEILGTALAVTANQAATAVAERIVRGRRNEA